MTMERQRDDSFTTSTPITAVNRNDGNQAGISSGGELVTFNVDHNFANALDGLIVSTFTRPMFACCNAAWEPRA